VPDEAASAEPVVRQRALTFTEEAMIRYADDCVAARDAAALKRSSTRRTPPKPASPAVEFNPYSDVSPSVVKPYGQSW
jgi:hypothetical protein